MRAGFGQAGEQAVELAAGAVLAARLVEADDLGERRADADHARRRGRGDARNCWFHSSTRMSASKTQMPWRTFSSASRMISWRERMAREASSIRSRASLPRDAPAGDQAGDDDAGRGGADGAGDQPLGGVDRLEGHPARDLVELAERAERRLGALGPDEARGETVQVAEGGGPRRPVVLERRGAQGDEALGLLALGAVGHREQRDEDVGSEVRPEAPQRRVGQRVEGRCRGARPGSAPRCRRGRRQAGLRDPAGLGDGGDDGGVEPGEEADRDCRRGRRRRCRASTPCRRSAPARTGRPRRRR